ncbi:MAG: hypothetical protein RSC31_00195, partial [Anaerovoracaceae bacterium]
RVESEKLGEERGIAIGKAEGKAEGEIEERTKIIINLLETMSVSDVSKVTKIPEEEVLKIQEEKN